MKLSESQSGDTATTGSNGDAMREPMLMMAADHYRPYRWVQAPIIALALWLILSPFSLGYSTNELLWSDVASGVAVLLLSMVALKPRYGLASWLIALVGLWLLFAPLVFWAKDAAVYLNDTGISGSQSPSACG